MCRQWLGVVGLVELPPRDFGDDFVAERVPGLGRSARQSSDANGSKNSALHWYISPSCCRISEVERPKCCLLRPLKQVGKRT